MWRTNIFFNFLNSKRKINPEIIKYNSGKDSELQEEINNPLHKIREVGVI